VISFDFRLASVEDSVDLVMIKIDRILTKVGLQRRTLCQQIGIEEEIVDVVVQNDHHADSLQDAESLSADWIGRNHLYMFIIEEQVADLIVYAWHQSNCTYVVLGVERDDIKNIRNVANPFQILGNLACSVSSAIKGSEWGIMSVNEDLCILPEFGLKKMLSSIDANDIEPAVCWVSEKAISKIGFRIDTLPLDRRYLKTLSGFYLILHDEGIENLLSIC